MWLSSPRVLSLSTHQLTNCSYSDSEFEYRHVQLPKAMLKVIPADYHDKSKGTLKLLWEEEWRAMGITQVGETRAIAEHGANATTEPWLGALRSA